MGILNKDNLPFHNFRDALVGTQGAFVKILFAEVLRGSQLQTFGLFVQKPQASGFGPQGADSFLYQNFENFLKRQRGKNSLIHIEKSSQVFCRLIFHHHSPSP